MIISRRVALTLIRQGRARVNGWVDHEGRRYAILDRLDRQRTDHYPLRAGESVQ
jgi:hypothetical protein